MAANPSSGAHTAAATSDRILVITAAGAAIATGMPSFELVKNLAASPATGAVAVSCVSMTNATTLAVANSYTSTAAPVTIASFHKVGGTGVVLCDASSGILVNTGHCMTRNDPELKVRRHDAAAEYHHPQCGRDVDMEVRRQPTIRASPSVFSHFHRHRNRHRNRRLILLLHIQRLRNRRLLQHQCQLQLRQITQRLHQRLILPLRNRRLFQHQCLLL